MLTLKLRTSSLPTIMILDGNLPDSHFDLIQIEFRTVLCLVKIFVEGHSFCRTGFLADLYKSTIVRKLEFLDF